VARSPEAVVWPLNLETFNGPAHKLTAGGKTVPHGLSLSQTDSKIDLRVSRVRNNQF
jgi:hypothetical protein